MKYPLILLAFLSICLQTNAQEIDHVLGDILIQLEEGKTPNRLLGELSFYEGEPSQITARQVVREPMNVWLLSFDYNAINEISLLHTIKSRRDILTAQVNHIIKPRLEPNDPLFSEQWQYINDGSNGTLDGDIDMEQAWDISTGGFTANGDQIVACVIDDGLDGSHMDFEDNLWVNTAEIPGNSIDDDNNGYIDDYNGYDAYTGTDAIFDGGGHGTPVAGIVGAKGNNGIGVSGVNWDVKLMIVQGGGNEAEALAAYAYPYWFRKKYNETNGAEGAFVVSTNASWGIDFGQPEDAPLWCSFYDSLGMVGILSCGATINGNQDVDAVGDLPTACGSEFLISVTNMNENDVKVNQAGYGQTTIDLGAHGADAYTAAFGNSYGDFGGTSGATPHVTGTIALAYSVQCTDLANLALSDPPAAAAFVRDMIFNGVDHNASLEGITTTEGRLNAYNTLTMIQTFCSECPPPFGVSATATDAQATVTWESPDSATGFALRIKELEGTDWDTLNNATAPVTLGSLLACTEYEIQLQSICKDTMSDFGPSLIIKTDGCCEIPEDFKIEVGDSTAIGIWNPKLAAVSYILEYRPIDSTEWFAVETFDTSAIMDQLDLCTSYEARLTMICNTEDTIMSEIVTFIAGCGACSSTEYCTGYNLNSFAAYIQSVELGEDIWVSGDDNGYGDYTGIFSFSVRQDAKFDLNLVQEYGPFEPPVIFSVWIDYNQNQVFEEEELAFKSDVPNIVAISGTIDVPQEAKVGYTRMRVAMRPFDDPLFCPNPDYFRGEVEDYCIWVGEEVFPCDLGFDVMIEDIELNGATLFWTPLDSATAYNIRYKTAEEEFNYFSAIDTFYEVIDLMECTDYIAEVRAVCAHDTSAYNTIMFKTKCSTSVNDPIVGLEALNVYPNPFQSDVLLSFELENALEMKIELYDITGREVYNDFHDLSSGYHTIQVDNLDNLSGGMYLLRMRSGNNQIIRKLIKS
jgi:hypothetical protein